MGIFGGKPKSDLAPEQIVAQLEQHRQRLQVDQQAIRAFIYFLKEFSFDLKEIEADAFKTRLDELVKVFQTEELPAKVERSFERGKEPILAFIAREKKYFEEREGELRDMVQLLGKSLTEISGENEVFNNQVYDRNLRMEKITLLDDIRKIKETLKVEVDQMKRVVQEKQAKDAQHLEKLSHEVSILKSDLERAKDASMTDGLTGANNRLAFDHYLKKFVERGVIAWDPFSLLMCDIDDFKRVNDQYGHPVGDRVLMAFVQKCRTMFRRDDFVSRYGGEEFAIVLPHASLRQAEKKARALCKAVAAGEYMIDPEHPEQKLTFTVSIGISFLRKTDTPETLIERADKALYAAKHTGKNRAVTERDIEKKK